MDVLSGGAILASRRWVRRTNPFPHVVAPQVFASDTAAAIAREVKKALASGAAGDADAPFVRSFPTTNPGPLGIFMSRWWHDLIAKTAGVAATGDIDISLHHHDTGDSTGHIHNDLAPGWFAGPRDTNGIAVADIDRCSYTTGETPSGLRARSVVRAVAVLYFTASPRWYHGAGGELGLFKTIDGPLEQPDAKVPPLDNSMVLFECTPHSYHAFTGNPFQERNALVMWLHRPKHEVVKRWGDSSIVYW
jgi:hypothetical protein